MEEGVLPGGSPWLWSDGRKVRPLAAVEFDSLVRPVFDTGTVEILSTRGGITFAVDPVEPVRSHLPSLSMEDRKRHLFSSADRSAKWIAGSSSGRLVEADGHAFAEAFVRAWNEHRPVRVSPDAVWMVLLETLQRRVDSDTNGCRSDMVRHASGRKDLVASLPSDFMEHQTEASSWPPVVAQLLDSMDRHVVGGRNRAVLPRFSTTTSDRAMATRIRVLAVYKSYFNYVGELMCGIPSVTLEGTASDWRLLRGRLSVLDACGLHPWVVRMGEILDQFVSAAEGRPSREFWRSFVRYTPADGDCGGTPTVDGWITLFFPPVQRKGANLAVPRSMDYTGEFSDHGEAPFTVPNAGPNGAEYSLVGGFAGVGQSSDGSLSPELGWAVWRRR